MMSRRLTVFVFFVLALIIGASVLAHRVFRNPVMYDPGSRQYALWREGKNPSFPKQKINGYLNEDIDRDALVRGLTLDQVKAKFYDVRTEADWTPYQRWCIDHHPQAADHQSVFLSDDWWGIHFSNGRATDFFLIKGC